MLVDIRVLAKGRLPADRVDHYRLASDDIWAMMVGRQLPVFDRYDDVFTAGMRMLPRDRQGARRISETREFFHFFRAELVRLNERWANRPRPAVRGAPRPARATPPD